MDRSELGDQAQIPPILHRASVAQVAFQPDVPVPSEVCVEHVRELVERDPAPVPAVEEFHLKSPEEAIGDAFAMFSRFPPSAYMVQNGNQSVNGTGVNSSTAQWARSSQKESSDAAKPRCPTTASGKWRINSAPSNSPQLSTRPRRTAGRTTSSSVALALSRGTGSSKPAANRYSWSRESMRNDRLFYG